MRWCGYIHTSLIQRTWCGQGVDGDHRQRQESALLRQEHVFCQVLPASQCVWADTETFRKRWLQIFLPRIRRTTHRPALLMDGCSSHEASKYDKGQVNVMDVVYPPNCTSIHTTSPWTRGSLRPPSKVLYRKELLDMKLSTMLVASQLRAEAAAHKMALGTACLHPHGSDAAELLKLSWSRVRARRLLLPGTANESTVRILALN